MRGFWDKFFLVCLFVFTFSKSVIISMWSDGFDGGSGINNKLRNMITINSMRFFSLLDRSSLLPKGSARSNTKTAKTSPCLSKNDSLKSWRYLVILIKVLVSNGKFNHGKQEKKDDFLPDECCSIKGIRIWH